MRGTKGTRIRKVDSEVYTVRRDLINLPELLSFLLVFLFLLHGRIFADDFVLLRVGQVSSNGLFRPKWKVLLFLYDRQSISRTLFVSYARLRSCHVKSRSIVQVLIF